MADPIMQIHSLGPRSFDSPYVHRLHGATGFVEDEARLLVDDRSPTGDADHEPGPGPTFELAGPRRSLFFDPRNTTIGIVSCGGLCPGLNDVVRGLVMVAWHRYGVRNILGFRYGYRGIAEADVRPLNPAIVSDIHEHGGTFLGSSRGARDVGEMVGQLEQLDVDVLFVIGGDGTLRGALAISEEARRRGRPTSVIGIPKTIDDDIAFVDHSFGFATAYSTATHVIRAAHEEARGAPNGVAVVKLMGLHSGFVASYATLACSHVNFVLVPEVPFRIDGEGGFLEALTQRLADRHHAVVVVAEGAGQEFVDDQSVGHDASGNVRLRDIGTHLAERIRSHLAEAGGEVSVKYIDPSYVIRSVPATAADSVYCWQLAESAVHAAMCGKSEMIVSRWHGRRVHVPITAATSERKRVDPHGELWLSVLDSTGQPDMG